MAKKGRRRRKRSQIGQLRSALYELAKFLGDVSAVQKGPEAAFKRLVRREVGKRASRGLWSRLR